MEGKDFGVWNAFEAAPAVDTVPEPIASNVVDEDIFATNQNVNSAGLPINSDLTVTDEVEVELPSAEEEVNTVVDTSYQTLSIDNTTNFDHLIHNKNHYSEFLSTAFFKEAVSLPSAGFVDHQNYTSINETITPHPVENIHAAFDMNGNLHAGIADPFADIDSTIAPVAMMANAMDDSNLRKDSILNGFEAVVSTSVDEAVIVVPSSPSVDEAVIVVPSTQVDNSVPSCDPVIAGTSELSSTSATSAVVAVVQETAASASDVEPFADIDTPNEFINDSNYENLTAAVEVASASVDSTAILMNYAVSADNIGKLNSSTTIDKGTDNNISNRTENEHLLGAEDFVDVGILKAVDEGVVDPSTTTVIMLTPQHNPVNAGIKKSDECSSPANTSLVAVVQDSAANTSDDPFANIDTSNEVTSESNCKAHASIVEVASTSNDSTAAIVSLMDRAESEDNANELHTSATVVKESDKKVTCKTEDRPSLFAAKDSIDQALLEVVDDKIAIAPTTMTNGAIAEEIDLVAEKQVSPFHDPAISNSEQAVAHEVALIVPAEVIVCDGEVNVNSTDDVSDNSLLIASHSTFHLSEQVNDAAIGSEVLISANMTVVEEPLQEIIASPVFVINTSESSIEAIENATAPIILPSTFPLTNNLGVKSSATVVDSCQGVTTVSIVPPTPMAVENGGGDDWNDFAAVSSRSTLVNEAQQPLVQSLEASASQTVTAEAEEEDDDDWDDFAGPTTIAVPSIEASLIANEIAEPAANDDINKKDDDEVGDDDDDDDDNWDDFAGPTSTITGSEPQHKLEVQNSSPLAQSGEIGPVGPMSSALVRDMATNSATCDYIVHPLVLKPALVSSSSSSGGGQRQRRQGRSTAAAVNGNQQTSDHSLRAFLSSEPLITAIRRFLPADALDNQALQDRLDLIRQSSSSSSMMSRGNSVNYQSTHAAAAASYDANGSNNGHSVVAEDMAAAESFLQSLPDLSYLLVQRPEQ